MTVSGLPFTLSFGGNDADGHEIDFYDISKALAGFQRTLALTTHVVLNGEVIVHATALKNAKIIALPPEPGSWKFLAVVSLLGTGLYNITTAPKDTPLGHLVYSAYDYVISETLGFHVDYEKSIGEKVEEMKARGSQRELPQSKLDAVIEKTQISIRDMHRPIVSSQTATNAFVLGGDGVTPITNPFSDNTFEYMMYSDPRSYPEDVQGIVSSYNVNTYKGRIFLFDERRPIPFQLVSDARNSENVTRIANSLAANAMERFSDVGLLNVRAFKTFSRSGRLKWLDIVDVA
jgi:hypothetical protein